jgi:hypothetical protein
LCSFPFPGFIEGLQQVPGCNLVRRVLSENNQYAERIATKLDRSLRTQDLSVPGIDFQASEPEPVLDCESHIPFPAALA